MVGYLALKDEDRNMTKKLLIVGLVVTFIWVVVGILLPTATYLMEVGILNQAAPAV